MKKKRIVIFGSYNGSSIGDTAILIGLISAIKEKLANDCIISVMLMESFDLHYELEKFGLNLNVETHVVGHQQSSIAQRAFRKGARYFGFGSVNSGAVESALKEADHLIIGGGNLIMDLFPGWPPILKEICSISNKSGVRYSFIGVGCGPVDSENGIKALKFCVENAEELYFRDAPSSRLSAQKLGRGGSIAADLATAIPYDACLSQGGIYDRHVILNVANVFGANWPYSDAERRYKYLVKFESIAKHLLNQSECNKFVLMNTNPKADVPAVKWLIDSLSHDKAINIINPNSGQTVFDLIRLSQGSKIALCTRLHAGILCSFSNCDLYMVDYQPKVKDVMENLGIVSSHMSVTDFVLNEPKAIFQKFGSLDTFSRHKNLNSAKTAVFSVIESVF